ncbi:MAG: hypothetical protein OCC49_16875 [Fibrobacterales bacterium]
MRKVIITAIASMVLVTCSTTKPKTVSIDEQGFTTKVSMQPGWLPNTEALLSLSATVSAETNELMLHAILPNRCNSDTDDALTITLDEELYFILPEKESIHCQVNSRTGSSETIQSYIITLPFLERLIKSDEVFVQINYADGEFSTSGYSTAKDGFVEFFEAYRNL